MTKWKSFFFWALSISIVILAISLSSPKTTPYKSHQLIPKTLFYKLRWFLHSFPKFNQNPSTNLNLKHLQPRPYCVLWMAPFLSGGGYSSEAWSYILAINDYIKNPVFHLAIEQHGDLESLAFWQGLPENMKSLAYELYQTNCRANSTIVICHSEPGAWYPPLFQTFPCPPGEYEDFMSVIGRTMFETDRVSEEHVRRCNKMDYVWVPSEFHVSTFTESGVEPSKVVKVVQSVDVDFFDPFKYEAIDLASLGRLVLGTGLPNVNLKKKEFVFLSVFKWEYRKGWDVLLEAYLKEFSKVDEVVLYFLVNAYHSDRDFNTGIMKFVSDLGIEKPVNGWAPIYVIDTHVAQIDLPRIYKSANAFVLPSRGEGWGRPIVEAMAMSLPVIATNWSGPTEYLSGENSYPLPIDRMREVMEEPFKGHVWAEPSTEKLRELMRHLMSNPVEAEAKGRKAREDMIRRFSPQIVAGIVADHIQHIISNKT